jgi:hypothetical protein
MQNLGLGLFEDRLGLDGSESKPETDENSDVDVEEEDAMEEDSDESSSGMFLSPCYLH